MRYAKSVRCGENIEAVLMSVEATPKNPVRRRSAELGVSQSSVHRILKHDLKMKHTTFPFTKDCPREMLCREEPCVPGS